METTDHDTRGRFAKGNQAARTHPFSARTLADAESQIAEKVSALAAEHGEEVSAVRLGLIRSYAEAEVLATLALRAVEELGIDSRRGARAFAKYERFVDRKIRIARQLGLGRASKSSNLAAQFAALHAGDAA